MNTVTKWEGKHTWKREKTKTVTNNYFASFFVSSAFRAKLCNSSILWKNNMNAYFHFFQKIFQFIWCLVVVVIGVVVVVVVFQSLFTNSFLFNVYIVLCISSAPTAKINGQTTPLDVTGLSQNEIQALLLGSHPSTQSVNVKREPEDLRKDPKCSRNQKVMNKKKIHTHTH